MTKSVDAKENRADVLQLLYKNPFFSELNPEQMQIAGLYWKLKTYLPETIIFKENDEPDCMYYVLDGRLSVLKEVKKNGKIAQVKVAEIPKDHLLGELAILENTKRSATVVTMEPTTLLVIQAKHFYLLVKSQPAIGVILLKKISQLISYQLRQTTNKYAHLEKTCHVGRKKKPKDAKAKPITQKKPKSKSNSKS